MQLYILIKQVVKLTHYLKYLYLLARNSPQARIAGSTTHIQQQQALAKHLA